MSAGRGLFGDGMRFLVGGVANTLLTILLYQALLFFVSAPLAFTLSWVAGLCFVIIVYPSRVFVGGRQDAGARFYLALAYMLSYLVGLVSLYALQNAGIDDRIAIFIVTVITTSANFVLGRLILRAGERRLR